MEADAGLQIGELRVDGGATANDLLMQFQADVLGVRVIRPAITEVTAIGAAYLAGLAVGYWQSVDELQQQWQVKQAKLRARRQPGHRPADPQLAPGRASGQSLVRDAG
jgi:glycerol kinase